jgi:hypothetical protein
MGEPMTVELDLNEANTRAEYIETALQASHWGTRLTPLSRIDREHAISLGKLIGAGQRRKAYPLILSYSTKAKNSRSSKPNAYASTPPKACNKPKTTPNY